MYAGLALLYLLAIPTGESPDEPGHLQCIEQVAIYNRLPLREPKPSGETWWARDSIIAGHMCYHMPLYYVAAGQLLEGAAALTGREPQYEFPPTNQLFGEEAALFLHPGDSIWELEDPPTLLALRLFSIILGAVLVAGSFLVGHRLAPAYPAVAALAAVLTAGWPQLAYLSRAITNDALATALAILTLLVLLRIGRPWRFAGLALLSSLAMLSKVSVGFAIVAVVLVWLVELRLYSGLRRVYGTAMLAAAGIWLGTAVLMAAHPVLREHLLISGEAFSGLAEEIGAPAYWQAFLQFTLSSGWARLGWMNLAAPLPHAYAWWILLTAAGSAGFLVLWRGAVTREQRVTLLVCTLWLAVVLLSYLRINVNRLQPQFRFMLAAVPVVSSWAAVGGLYGIRDRARVQWLVVAGVALLLVSYNMWLVLTIVKDAYA